MKKLFFMSLLLLTILSASCLAAGPARADEYTPEEIKKEARELGRRLEMPPDKLAEMLKVLGAALSDPWYKQASQSMPTSAVFVFMAGEGGVVVKFMTGQGLISFKNGRLDAPLFIRSWSAGLQAGGAAQYGVGLVMGLTREENLGGDYTGGFTKAVAGDEATPNGSVFSQSDPITGFADHLVYIISSARGFYAGVGGAKVTITPNW
ncbi:MAG: hypothetical protein V1816_24690 [Pseudomonadota bacterium]